MGKLIDTDTLRKYIGLSERCEDCDRDKNACRYDQVFTRMDICGWLDDAPEAVVRCSDCIYWDTQDRGTVVAKCNYQSVARYLFYTDADDFCSQGKKKTDEGS